MKGKPKEQNPLSGVCVAILAPKGRMGKNLTDSLTKLGCEVQQAESLIDLQEAVEKNPAQALIVETSFCEELR